MTTPGNQTNICTQFHLHLIKQGVTKEKTKAFKDIGDWDYEIPKDGIYLEHTTLTNKAIKQTENDKSLPTELEKMIQKGLKLEGGEPILVEIVWNYKINKWGKNKSSTMIEYVDDLLDSLTAIKLSEAPIMGCKQEMIESKHLATQYRVWKTKGYQPNIVQFVYLLDEKEDTIHIQEHIVEKINKINKRIQKLDTHKNIRTIYLILEIECVQRVKHTITSLQNTDKTKYSLAPPNLEFVLCYNPSGKKEDYNFCILPSLDSEIKLSDVL